MVFGYFWRPEMQKVSFGAKFHHFRIFGAKMRKVGWKCKTGHFWAPWLPFAPLPSGTPWPALGDVRETFPRRLPDQSQPRPQRLASSGRGWAWASGRMLPPTPITAGGLFSMGFHMGYIGFHMSFHMGFHMGIHIGFQVGSMGFHMVIWVLYILILVLCVLCVYELSWLRGSYGFSYVFSHGFYMGLWIFILVFIWVIWIFIWVFI